MPWRVGTRQPDGYPVHQLQPGEYSKTLDGRWYAHVPHAYPDRWLVGNLSKHDVTEHEDGSITVSPSILVTSGRDDQVQWHGYLERGVWREC
jgi:hypothetical protein